MTDLAEVDYKYVIKRELLYNVNITLCYNASITEFVIIPHICAIIEYKLSKRLQQPLHLLL